MLTQLARKCLQFLKEKVIPQNQILPDDWWSLVLSISEMTFEQWDIFHHGDEWLKKHPDDDH